VVRLLVLFFLLLSPSAQADWKSDLETFRKDNEDSLKKNWLVVVGLFWLHEGENTLGASESSLLNCPRARPIFWVKLLFARVRPKWSLRP
jgi:hypothetical protein